MAEKEECKDDTELLSSPFSAVLGIVGVLLKKTQLHLCSSLFISLRVETAFRAEPVTLNFYPSRSAWIQGLLLPLLVITVNKKTCQTSHSNGVFNV